MSHSLERYKKSLVVTNLSLRLSHSLERYKKSLVVTEQQLVVVGFTYSPVNPLLLLTGHGIVVSSRRVDGCGSSSFDPPFLFRFPRFSIEVSTCCLEEVPGVGLWGTLSLFRLLWLCHTSSVDPVWVWGLLDSSSIAVSDAVPRLSLLGAVVVIGSAPWVIPVTGEGDRSLRALFYVS